MVRVVIAVLAFGFVLALGVPVQASQGDFFWVDWSARPDRVAVLATCGCGPGADVVQTSSGLMCVYTEQSNILNAPVTIEPVPQPDRDNTYIFYNPFNF